MNRIHTLCLSAAVSAMLLGQISTAWGADNKFQQGVRGGGGGAVRSAPAMPHVAAPHFSAPRMSTPHFAAPRASTPHFAAPRVNTQRFTAPRLAAPRVSAPVQHVATPRNFATTSRNFNRGSATRRNITHTPTVNRNAITNNNVINRNAISRTNRNLALRNNITPNTRTAAGTNANRFNATNRNFNRFGNRNNAAAANRQFAAARAARANNARFAAYRYGAFHSGWNPARSYYWNHHHWRCYNGVWAVVDAGWPGDWYDYPYPFAYDNTVYYGGDVYEPVPQIEAVGGSMVADVQADLANMGYNPGPADGIVGPQTSDAIAQYQQDNGLDVTGQIDGPLLDSLGL